MKKVIKYTLIFSFVSISCLAQQEGQNYAGVESLFSMIGTGAKFVSMGGAASAYPDDPSAFAWNPAGMTVVQRRGMVFSLFTLFEGVQYQYFSYIHPTLNSGTFGIGITRLGVEDINFYDDVDNIPYDRGEYDFWKGKLTIAYALNIFKGFSTGVNFNVYRDILGFYSANGFGIDAGLHYGILSRGILNDLHFGFSMFNCLQPKLKMKTEQDILPYTIRAGIAKKINFRKDKNYLLIAADIEKPQYRQRKYHIGTELSWGKKIFIRAGYVDEEFTFGAGLRLSGLQFDYGLKSIGDPEYFPKSNLFSLKMFFGKSIPEERELLEEKRRLEIQRRFNARVQAEEQRLINDGLKAGKIYLKEGDFFNARVEFSRVLRTDNNNREASNLLQETTEKEQFVQQKHQNELLQNERNKVRQQKDNAFISKKLSEGIEALQVQNYKKAIEKWEEALERDPQNLQIKKYIRQAEGNLDEVINDMIAEARRLIKKGNVSDAYKVLNKAKEQAAGNDKIYNKVIYQIADLNTNVDFITNYQDGISRYENKDYINAVRYLKKALGIKPDHVNAAELYVNALAHAKGNKQIMIGKVKEKFNEGIKKYREGFYEDALKLWKEALELDPYNIKLLKAIDGVNNKLEIFRKK